MDDELLELAIAIVNKLHDDDIKDIYHTLQRMLAVQQVVEEKIAALNQYLRLMEGHG